MELLLGTSRPWPALPLIAFVFVYFLSKTKLAGTIIGQCVLMFADAMVRNVASQLETDQNFEAFFFLHSPYPDGPLIIIIIIIIFFFNCMRLHVGSRRDRFMEAILLRQLACRCAGRAFGEAIACLTGTWRRIGVITTSIWRCIEVGATS